MMTKPLETPQILTTARAAELLGMSEGLVKRHVDSGKLRGWRVPGTLHRRLRLKDVVAFARLHHIPLDEPGAAHAVVITQDAALGGEILVQAGSRFFVTVAWTTFDAGLLGQDNRIDFALLDFAHPHFSGMLTWLVDTWPGARRIVLAPRLAPGEIAELKRQYLLVDGVLCQPFSTEDIGKICGQR